MKTLNKILLMGGAAACAVAFSSCAEKKADSADATPDKGNESASAETTTASDEKTETVSLNLSGLK